jgi:hypothetical protein
MWTLDQGQTQQWDWTLSMIKARAYKGGVKKKGMYLSFLWQI